MRGDTGPEVATGTTADPSGTTRLVRLWVLGWAAVRGVPPPVAHGAMGWRVQSPLVSAVIVGQ